MLFNYLVAAIMCNECKQFGLKCEKCNETSCLTCSDGTYLDLDQQSTTFGRCVICKPNCLKCSSETKCSECNFLFGLNREGECVSCEDKECYKCPTNYKVCKLCKDMLFDDHPSSPTYGKCTGCKIENCIECPVLNAYKCTRCKDGFVLISETECQKCPENCEQCVTDMDNIIHCYDCYDGYMLNADEECQKCSIDHCSYCFINNNNEEECNRCFESEGYVISDGICIKGDPNCISYDINSQCITCNYYYGFNENKICTECEHENCKMCFYDYTECNECDEGYFLNKDTYECEKSCLDPNCEICSIKDYTQCEKCIYGYRLDDNKKCQRCTDINCVWCDENPDICTQCFSGYSLLNKSNTCSKCNGLCNNCDDNNDFLDCVNCKNNYGFNFIKGSPDYGKCVRCKDKGCIKCDGDPNVCNLCFVTELMHDGICTNETNDGNDDNNDTNDNENSIVSDNDGSNTGGGIDNDNSNKENNDKKDNKLPIGAIIGIAVGCVIVVGIAIFLTVYCIRKKNKVENLSS